MQKTDKLISANALLEKVQFRVEVKGVVGSTVKDVVEITRKLIDDAPAVDAVEVVRCGQCKNYMTIHCTCDGCCISPDWYCTDGERRDTDGS